MNRIQILSLGIHTGTNWIVEIGEIYHMDTIHGRLKFCVNGRMVDVKSSNIDYMILK